MKTIEFLKKYWTVVLIAGLLIFIGLSGTVSKCQIKHTDQIVTTVEASINHDQIVDSMKSLQAAKELAKIDSVNKAYEKKLVPLKKENATLKLKLESQQNDYQADTAAQSPQCDSIQKTYARIVDNLEQEVKLISNIKNNMQLHIDIQNTMIDEGKVSLAKSYSYNGQLIKELKIQTNWWHRNDKYVYMGAGVVGTLVIIKLISGFLIVK